MARQASGEPASSAPPSSPSRPASRPSRSSGQRKHRGAPAAATGQGLPSEWVVGPSDAQYDAETAAAGGNTEHPEGTVVWDDLTYRGC